MQGKVDADKLLILGSIPECENNELIDFSEIVKSKSKGGKGNSPYQEFIKECMRRRKEPVKERMKKCAEEYKKQKKR